MQTIDISHVFNLFMSIKYKFWRKQNLCTISVVSLSCPLPYVPLPCTLAMYPCYPLWNKIYSSSCYEKKKIIFSCVYNSAPRWVAKFNLFHLHIIKKKYSIWYLYWNICKHLILITNFANMSCQMYFLLYKRKKKKKEEQDISTK